MIYSKKLGTYTPVRVTSKTYNLEGFGKYTKYQVYDGKIPFGFVDVKDIDNGINVEFIKNMYPELYSGFGKIADQIEVEHCMKRGLTNFKIISTAALNSHALHFLRGKRFFDKKIEAKIKKIISETPIGGIYNTKHLGGAAMYMPKKLIAKYIEIIKKSPLLLK